MDFESVVDDSIVDIYEPTGTNDLWLGTQQFIEHPYTLDELTLFQYDANQPWNIPERGLLFYFDRYLTSPNAATGDIWMLQDRINPQQQLHFFTIEAWVRKDLDNGLDDRMGIEPGQVFHKM